MPFSKPPAPEEHAGTSLAAQRSATISVGGLEVAIEWKKIKNLHIGVYPPQGRVRVASPLVLSEDAVRLAVVTRLPWIHRQRRAFEEQPRQTQRRVVGGESHWVFGRRLRLRLIESASAPKFVVRGQCLELHARPNLSEAARRRALREWSRAQLKQALEPLICKWSEQLNVTVTSWQVKQMKTKWGTCNERAGRVWFNLELSKKPLPCIEYLVVHELLHLIEPSHSARFVSLLDEHLPAWRRLRDELNALPLGYDEWREGEE